MIRTRFTVALVAVLALIGGGYTWAALDAPVPVWVGATDPAHVAAANAMLAVLPTPAGMTLDPYGTGCDFATLYCFTSSSVEPEAAFAATTRALVAHGGRVRSHACSSHGLIEHACDAVVDYQGSGIDVVAGHSRPGNALTHLRLSVTGAANPQRSPASAPYGSWSSVGPLPAAWTTGTRCVTQEPTGCRRFDQPLDAAPRVAAPLAQMCAEVRSRIVGSYFLINDVNSPPSALRSASCGFFAHRFRTLGGHDGEVLVVTVQALDPQHSALHLMLCQWANGGCVRVGGR
ncbi:MAG: hypothetical protein QOE76_734 [Frankiales bacterium]|jgi:hypothetical protein|nr:hypothetical protein [Frankiales bacterium]